MDQPVGGLGTHVIIGLVATAILIIAMVLYFFFWNNPNTSTITIKNNGTSALNVLVSSPNSSGTATNIPVKRIVGGSSFSFFAYPGTSLDISGYTDGNQNPLTVAKLVLGNSGVVSTGKIVFDGITYSNLTSSANSTDQYGVSLQKGYNVPITIYPNNNNLQSDTNNIFTCSGPIWYQNISESNSIFPCPDSLDMGDNCINPCERAQQLGEDYCKCENEWPQLDYYYVFASSCPNCLITTCDTLNYSCSTNNINNHTPVNYDVVFFPDLGNV